VRLEHDGLPVEWVDQYFAADALAWLPGEADLGHDYATRAVEAYSDPLNPFCTSSSRPSRAGPRGSNRALSLRSARRATHARTPEGTAESRKSNRPSRREGPRSLRRPGRRGCPETDGRGCMIVSTLYPQESLGNARCGRAYCGRSRLLIVLITGGIRQRPAVPRDAVEESQGCWFESNRGSQHHWLLR